MSGNRKIKKIAGATAVMLGTVFTGMKIWAKVKKGDSVYRNEPSEQNPMEGKKVIFVKDENDAENADGVRGHLEAIGDSDYHPSFYAKYVKRFLDVVLSFCGLVVLSPVFIGISIAIFIDDPGPIFFTQKRLGQNKKYFKLHKFRSMKMSTPHDVPTHMLDNPEQYITKVGKFIRSHSLDELPQIWDIFIGNMSVIGPRPGLWNQDVLTAERDKYGANDVKPGLTGWAQINGRDELEIPEKAKLDGEYCRNIDFKIDSKVFLNSLGVLGGDANVIEGGIREMKMNQYNINNKQVNDIACKKILFFSPAFFGYEYKIVRKMEEMGAFVDMYDVRSVTNAMSRALLKISPNIFLRKSLNYYEKIINDNLEKNYDYILIIKCDMTPKSILKKLKEKYPNAKLCLYLWDSIDNIPGVTKKFKYFDTLHSFDMEDCKKYKELKFRPLFYSDEFCKTEKKDKLKYDVSFIGTIHSDRITIINQVRDIFHREKLNSYFFCYLQSKFVYYFYKATKKEFLHTNINDFKFEKMSSEEVAEIIDKSKIVLDIQHPKQTGLTIRTIEMIGMNKKLITTNKSILKYDFYNPNNIKVIDRNDIQIDKEFIELQYIPLETRIYTKYSLYNWILEVLS